MSIKHVYNNEERKNAVKNNKTLTAVTLNIDTDFMIDFLILQKSLKIKFLRDLPSEK